MPGLTPTRRRIRFSGIVSRRRDSFSVDDRAVRCLRAFRAGPVFRVGGDNEEEDEVRERVRRGGTIGESVRLEDSDEVETDADVVDCDRTERGLMLRALYLVVRSFLSSDGGES